MPAWKQVQKNGANIWRCQHPHSARRLITHIAIETNVNEPKEIIIIDVDSAFVKQGIVKKPFAIDGRVHSTSIEIKHEINSLLELDPCRKNLRRWLLSISRKKRRWKAITHLANSQDETLRLSGTDSKRYDELFITTLFKLGLLQLGNIEGLRPLMAFSKAARLRWHLLNLICESQDANLALLHWRRDIPLDRQDRLLMIRRLAISEIYPTILKEPGIEKTESSFPTIQYWEGDPPPPEINSEINAWRRDSPPLSHHLYNAAEADQWINKHYSSQDAIRFRQCWHPAMQADFLRILMIAKTGGVYLDCDTPHLHGEGLARWHKLTRHCLTTKTLAICVNTLAGPGYCTQYIVNCCIWSCREHPFALQWVQRYRERLDATLQSGLRSPGAIHQLGPDLVSELVDELIREPSTKLTSLEWNNRRLPQLSHEDWNILLLDTDNYKAIFNNPFDGYCSYANCNDPRDWRVSQ